MNKEEEQKRKKTESKSVMLVIAIIIICISLVIWMLIYKFSIYRNNIEFKIIGEETVVVEVGNEYKEEGVYAKIFNNNVSYMVNISSNIDTNTLGLYEIKYELNIWYLRAKKELYRKVCVVDTTKPNLTINSEKEITIYEGENFQYPTYTAIDNYDGDITNNVKIDSNLDEKKRGTYEIKYSVKDSSGNETINEIKINVKKKKNPYIVVSISKQTLEYYEYGELVLFSNVVTGINGKTPKGTFKVLNKATNVILKGEDYESFVNYWIAFKGHSFGFHDASWRNKFGGTIYKTNGSHGCVNMPYSKVQKLYNMVSIGTPVYIKK